MCVNVPQASTMEAWYTARLTAQLLNTGYYEFGALAPVQLVNKSAMLWRVVGSRFAASCGMEALLACQDTASPLSIQLASISGNGELTFPDLETVVDNNPIPENVWKVAKDPTKPIFVKPSGRIEWSPNLAGFSEITLFVQYQIQTINDSEFIEKFRKGCI